MNVTDSKQMIADGLMKAMRAEREGHSFYLMASNSTEDPKGQEVFQQLAKDEHDHMVFLKTQYDSVMATGKVDAELKLRGRTEFAGNSPIFSDGFKKRIKDAHYEMTALSIGIQLELDAVKYYQSQSDAAEDSSIKQFYAELADWERGHYNVLNQQYNELKQDYWADGGFSPF